VYLWAVVAANDLGLISRAQARDRIRGHAHRGVASPARHDLLYQWYDTTTGHVLKNPGDADCTTETTPTFDNCYFISNVDNGWYASGLIVTRQALPDCAAGRPTRRARTSGCSTTAGPDALQPQPGCPGHQPTGQMFGGYYVGLPSTRATLMHYYHNGALYSDPRISAYLGLGLHQMPVTCGGAAARAAPARAVRRLCEHDPDFSWQGQCRWSARGRRTGSSVGTEVPGVEGHYTYPGSTLTFVPTFAGGLFEASWQRGRARDVVGPTQLRPRRRAHGAGADQVLDRAAAAAVWGMSRQHG